MRGTAQPAAVEGGAGESAEQGVRGAETGAVTKSAEFGQSGEAQREPAAGTDVLAGNDRE